MKRREKKGFTLVEVVCALAVASLAMLCGAQLLLVGARAYGNGATLDHNTKKIVRAYETGTFSPEVAAVKTSSQLTLVFPIKGGAPLTVRMGETLCTTEITDSRGITKTTLRILERSLPGGGP